MTVQRLAPDVVLLTGSAVDVMRYAVALARRARQRNGLPDTTALVALATALEPVSAQGHSDLTPGTDHDTEGVDDTVTIEEAARILGCTERHARRLAPRIGGHRKAGRWLIDRHTLTEHLEGKV